MQVAWIIWVMWVIWVWHVGCMSYMSYVSYISIFRIHLTLFRMGIFGAAHGSRGKMAPSLKSVTHMLQWWNLALLYLTKRRSKKYMNHVTHSLSAADITIFSPEIIKFCYIKKYRYRLHFDTYFLIFFSFSWVFKDFF